MAGIKEPIMDILSTLTAIEVVNADLNTVCLYARVWNNQLRDIEKGKSYEWPRPAAFLEVLNPVTYDIIGLGFRSADIGCRIHLVTEFYDAQDGTFEQNLVIFDLRDKVIATLTGYCPTACSPLNCVREEQSYDHDNLYHYILDFVCNFIDSKGSKYDPLAGEYFDTANPLLDETTVRGGIPVPIPDPDPEFIIPQ